MAKLSDINQLWKTYIHYVSMYDGMYNLMAVKYCFSKKWGSWNFPWTCTAKDCIKSIEEVHARRYNNSNLYNLVLKKDNRRYIAMESKGTTRVLSILHEYIKKQVSENNGDIELFHNSLKADYIQQDGLKSYENDRKLIEYVFNNYKAYSSINYLIPVEFEKRCNNKEEFMDKFKEDRRKKIGRRLKNRRINKRELIEIWSNLLNFNVLLKQHIKLLKCACLNLDQKVDRLEIYNLFKFSRFGYMSKRRHNISNSFFLLMKSLNEELLL